MKKLKIKYHFVYQTINLVNGKTYIGVHSTYNLKDGYIGNGIHAQSYAERESKRIERKSNRFLSAVLKYGYKNFKLEILSFYDTREEALDEEEFLVNKDYIKLENNYNIAIGGRTRLKPIIKSQKIYQYSLSGELIKLHNGIDNVMFELNIVNNGMIYNAINSKANTCLGFVWSYKELNFNSIERPKTLKRKVAQIDIKTNETINIFNKISEVIPLGYDPSSITKVCKGLQKSVKGFKWEYIDDDIV